MANNGLKLSSNLALKNTLRSILAFTMGGVVTLAALIFLGLLKTNSDETNSARDQVLVDQFRLVELESYKMKKEAEEAAERKIAEKLKAYGSESKESNATLSGNQKASSQSGNLSEASSAVAFNAVSASIEANQGQVKWTTATERNSSIFLIERSEDGVHFSQKGMKIAKGNSSTPHTYEFKDKKLREVEMPVVFYRIRHVGMDGSSTYSGSTEVDLPVRLGLYTQIKKDNSQKAVTLQYASDNRRTVNIKITHQDGNTMLEQTLAASPVSKTMKVEVGDWPKGNYFLHMFDDLGSTTESFVLR